MSTILVTGATGLQGGATARHLLARGMRVHALVRTKQSAAALDLHARGAVLVEGNFDEPEQLKAACKNTTAVFLNVSPSFRGDGAELRQASNVIRAARAVSTVTTLVYTSVCAIDQREQFPGWTDGNMSGLMKGYFESKAAIEELVRSAGFMYWTILHPPVYMTNYLLPSVRGYFPELAKSRTLRTAMAVEKRTMLINPDDIGRIAASVLIAPNQFSHRAVDIGGEALTAQQIADAIFEVSGREIVVDHIIPRLKRSYGSGSDRISSTRWNWRLSLGSN
ncbi:uncharacterized protein N7483_011511 [Penicillium malachiteum]|uniref:uncharacterized protein n=1 Tax=Penicillium malachiteum TaxID=1324776 RepID=UPI0025498119|nr:uncharacterized protein N7483_011511 [Penicillium malachiteum]KAJ5714330.1 hypothetical protein N7483_011511 [Penicillium malachiteum]